MSPLAVDLARWATEFEPGPQDLALADRSLRDTLAVMVAARGHELRPLFERLGVAGQWAAQAHVLDYDDLHLASTAHISAVCVPATLACGGGARAYLAGAGVMARLGTALGWSHYHAGWHATCTAGAPAAAVTAAVALGLDASATAVAIALAVPAAGGVQAAFGTDAKSLQVGFAVAAGVRAAELAAAGATADPIALDDWFPLVGGSGALSLDDGAARDLAVKLYPCCYALQRPIHAMTSFERIAPDEVQRVVVRTPASSLQPLIHHRPRTGLQGKFSLEYAVAAALLDGRPDLVSFTDAAVQRGAAQRLIERVEVEVSDEGDGLLAGEVEISLQLSRSRTERVSLDLPPGAPGLPPTEAQLLEKLAACAGPLAGALQVASFDSARALLA